MMSIIPFQQQTQYSCVASLLQSLSLYLKGRPLSHEEAIRQVRCTPKDGAQLENIAQALKMKTRYLRTWEAVHKALTKQNPVVCDDNLTYCDPHAILLVGATPAGVYVLDPATGKIRWKSRQWLWKACEELYVLV